RPHAKGLAGVACTGGLLRRRTRRETGERHRHGALRTATSLLRGRSPDLRAARTLFLPGVAPSRAWAQWPMPRLSLAYRCGGSAGMAARAASPASRFNPAAHAAGSPRSGGDCSAGPEPQAVTVFPRVFRPFDAGFTPL